MEGSNRISNKIKCNVIEAVKNLVSLESESF